MRRIKEGTSAVLLQSGLDENRLADSMECFAHLRNIQDLLSGGKSPHKRRFGEPFYGPIIPFGSVVEHYPISCERPVKNSINLERKSHLDCFLDTLCTRCEPGWVDVLVADL